MKKVKGGKVEDVDLDKDDGKTYYEVEMERKNKEYEVLVDAYTAKVLKVETGDDIDEDDDDDQDNNSTESQLKHPLFPKVKR